MRVTADGYKIDDMLKFLMVFIGGGLGSMLRFGIGQWIIGRWPQSILAPALATFTSNMFASGILAATLWYATEKASLSDPLKALIMIGFCGGFSTFSTFGYETFHFIRSGYPWIAIFNITASVLISLLIIWKILGNPS